MSWFVMGPVGVTRDLWVTMRGPTAPEYGVWRTPSGKSIPDTLATEGPPGVQGVEWYFMPMKGHRGKRLVDALWQFGDGLKIYSECMCAVLESRGAHLQTWPADVRYLDGSPVEGYRAVLEEVDAPGPVHSMWRGRREGRVVVDEPVRTALEEAGVTGIEFEQTQHPFPGDHGFNDRQFG